MAKINLLPWRDELRRKRKRDFFSAMGAAALVTGAAFLGVHAYIDSLQSYQEQRNKMLEGEIATLDKKIIEIRAIEEKKSKLLSKIDLIHKLQESRPEIVHLFDEIPKATPDGVFLSKFTQVGRELIFEGKSQSNARVSAFMRAIDVSPWLEVPRLDVIQVANAENAEQLSDFVLHATLGQQHDKTEAVK
jgi:type IV pilus assembly protein PilN